MKITKLSELQEGESSIISGEILEWNVSTIMQGKNEGKEMLTLTLSDGVSLMTVKAFPDQIAPETFGAQFVTGFPQCKTVTIEGRFYIGMDQSSFILSNWVAREEEFNPQVKIIGNIWEEF